MLHRAPGSAPCLGLARDGSRPLSRGPEPAAGRHVRRSCGRAQRQRGVRGAPLAAPRWPARRAASSCAAAGSVQGPSRADAVTVVEYLLLLRLPGAAPDAVQDLLDAAWSLQFMAPAIMCASVGPVAWQQACAAAVAAGGSGGGSGGFTHAAHFRVASRAALTALLAHPLHAALLVDAAALASSPSADASGASTTETSDSSGAAVVQVALEGSIARELEGMFRRGGEYAEGSELLLLLAPPPGSATGAAAGGEAEGGAADFASRLAALAESAAGGALQASCGGTLPLPGGSSGTDPRAHATHALLARFPTGAQADAFWATPPCAAAAAGDPRLPLHAHSALVFAVEPGQEGSSRRQGL